jgi:phospholipid/cholesterol/gamma-HCH transport system substrate-binding protein
MENGARVKMRGVQVGRVGGIEGGGGPVNLRLEIDPGQVARIPANVEAQISVTTAFGAKFVDLVPPEHPSTERLSAGAVLTSRNVTTEVNTVFENIVDLLDMVDPAKMNAVLSAIADAVRGQGPRMGEATMALNDVLTEVNARSATMHRDWRSFKGFNDAYAAVADDIVSILDSAATTASTVVEHSAALDSLLLNVTGFAQTGTNLLATSKDSFIEAVNPSHRPLSCCTSTTRSTPVPCRARPGSWSTAAGISGAAPMGSRSNSTSPCSAATMPTSFRRTCPSSRPRAVRADNRDAGRYPMRRRTSRCASWSPTPAGEPESTSGRTPVSKSMLGQLFPCHPCGARATQRQTVPVRTRDRPRAVPRCPAIRRGVVRGRWNPAVARHPAGAPTAGTDTGRSPGAVTEKFSSVVWRLALFLAVCALGAFVLLSVFAQFRFGEDKSYRAEFVNVSGLRDGDLVRIAGVEVGKVESIEVADDATVSVAFGADDSVVLTEGSRAAIRYDNLFGGRYLALEEGPGECNPCRPAGRSRWRAPNPLSTWTR